MPSSWITVHSASKYDMSACASYYVAPPALFASNSDLLLDLSKLSMSNPGSDHEADADSLPNNRVVAVAIVNFLVFTDVNLRTNNNINEYVVLEHMIALCPYYAYLLLTLSCKSTT